MYSSNVVLYCTALLCSIVLYCTEECLIYTHKNERQNIFSHLREFLSALFWGNSWRWETLSILSSCHVYDIINNNSPLERKTRCPHSNRQGKPYIPCQSEGVWFSFLVDDNDDVLCCYSVYELWGSALVWVWQHKGTIVKNVYAKCNTTYLL